MDSGIYKLTFASGNFYIGKSEQISKRWKTHEANFAKGTHTKKMQAEYDRSGPPVYEVMLPVHSDHIDIYEGILIDRHWGEGCLNTTRPKPQDFEQSTKYLEYYDNVTVQDICIMLFSTLAHVEALVSVDAKCNQLSKQLIDAQEELDELIESGIRLPQTWQENYEALATEVEALRILNNEQLLELYRVKKLSLWDRVFNYIVYV